MRDYTTMAGVHQDRGERKLPLERVYRYLCQPETLLRAYDKIGRNKGAMTGGSSSETVDGMSQKKVERIADCLRKETYYFNPARRTYIPKKSGGKRPLGIPDWSDKLVQEALKMVLEPYYEGRFRDCSHGFRPRRSCHTALRKIYRTWNGTKWMIEGDVSDCFGSIDHEKLLEVLKRDIHDGRTIELVRRLLNAGVMEELEYKPTLSGTPQGGVVSPLLANIFLDQLDVFVEDVLIPKYSRGVARRRNPAYRSLQDKARWARKQGNRKAAQRLRTMSRQLPSTDPDDSGYRKLRYIRYADDFILGWSGPKAEAEAIKQELAEFMDRIGLKLSPQKTLITHMRTGKARFLGFDLTSGQGKQRHNRCGQSVITLLMPKDVTKRFKDEYMERGKVHGKLVLTRASGYEIVQRYQSILRGVYNYYAPAINVGQRMSEIKNILQASLLMTLAEKFKITVSKTYRRFVTVSDGYKAFQVVVQRENRQPLIATFGGFSMARNTDMKAAGDFDPSTMTRGLSSSDLLSRMLAEQCEICGIVGEVQVHHVRHIRTHAKLDSVTASMRRANRKTLVVCLACHWKIHSGQYNGVALKTLLESRMR